MSGTLGKFLKAAREKHEMPIREVEKITGISNAYISQIETGAVEQPSPNKLQKLASCYGLDYSSVMSAAGYLVESKKDQVKVRDLNTLLLTSEAVTENEAAALANFLVHLRRQAQTQSQPKRRKT